MASLQRAMEREDIDWDKQQYECQRDSLSWGGREPEKWVVFMEDCGLVSGRKEVENIWQRIMYGMRLLFYSSKREK